MADRQQDIYSAALVVIGNEILSGRTSDANTPWIAERLNSRGIVLSEVRIIADKAASIVDAVNTLRTRFDYVFTTGGIGPTHDDITAECVAKAFGLELERNTKAFEMLEEYYGLEELTPPRAKMSLIPVGATLIPNPVSAAPGFIIENVYVMAGVPRIMQAMMDHILSGIKAGKPILSNTIACTLPESIIATELGKLQDEYPDIEIGSYPHYRGGALGLNLVLRSTKRERLQAATDELIALIKAFGDEPRALSIKSNID
jgi:molybdenum cofactor synthesis domain-containing protein